MHDVIPGGAHTYAKGDDQWPEEVPAAIAHGAGCRVVDTGGRQYLEYGSGSRAVVLGHAHPAVVDAAARELRRGTNFTRPAAIELEAAETLLEMVPAAEMVKFTKDGSTVTTAAVKLARAHTGRPYVALCADHPFFSYDDWFIGTTAVDAGIPPEHTALSLRFNYNDIDSVHALFRNRPGQIACVILEAEKLEPPRDGFLQELQALCRREGAVLILDEMITGFRYHEGGAQTLHGLTPGLSCFGKALANGFSVSALVGRRELMERGGLRHDQERVFLLSTTHGGETHGLAAAIATMRTIRDEPVIPGLRASGERLKAGVNRVSAAMGMLAQVEVIGNPVNLVYTTRDADGRPSQPLRTLFMQELLRRGVLAPSFVVNYAHREQDIDDTIVAVEGALAVYAAALEDGVELHLAGAPVQPVYRRHNRPPAVAPGPRPPLDAPPAVDSAACSSG